MRDPASDPVRYREHPVAPALAPYVASVWTLEVFRAGWRQTVLPDGCVDWLFEVGRWPAGCLVGSATRPLVADPAAGAWRAYAKRHHQETV